MDAWMATADVKQQIRAVGSWTCARQKCTHKNETQQQSSIGRSALLTDDSWIVRKRLHGGRSFNLIRPQCSRRERLGDLRVALPTGQIAMVDKRRNVHDEAPVRRLPLDGPTPRRGRVCAESSAAQGRVGGEESEFGAVGAAPHSVALTDAGSIADAAKRAVQLALTQ